MLDHKTKLISLISLIFRPEILSVFPPQPLAVEPIGCDCETNPPIRNFAFACKMQLHNTAKFEIVSHNSQALHCTAQHRKKETNPKRCYYNTLHHTRQHHTLFFFLFTFLIFIFPISAKAKRKRPVLISARCRCHLRWLVSFHSRRLQRKT